MAASLLDSAMHARLFPTGEAARLFTDSAVIRALLLVEGALAKAQGARGIIPEVSAAAIQRAAMEVQIDPAALADSVGENGVVIPGLIEAFRAEMNAPEHAQYVHWGATSQDILDTGLMLRLRQSLALAEADLRALIAALGAAAERHAALPMIARTYGQHAVPTTWGAVVAGWGAPLADALDALGDLRETSLWVSLSGAAGTATALGPDSAALRGDLAKALGLGDPGRSWHADRTPVLRITGWLAQLSAPLLAMGETLLALSGSDVGEVSLRGAGRSSTMPQKQNPVQPSALVALARQAPLNAQMVGLSAGHTHQRDGAAWLGEWLALPQAVLGTLACLQTARALAESVTPEPARMAAALTEGLGLFHAEALSFALAATMPRTQAQAETKALCVIARDTQRPLADVARAAHPDLPATLFDPAQLLGTAPAEARAFAVRARALG
jgi:3-carboxy-cis,cis-muconate cycloisomerase